MCLPVQRNIEINFMGFVQSKSRTLFRGGVTTRQGEVIWLIVVEVEILTHALEVK